jgi:hypothetical protein
VLLNERLLKLKSACSRIIQNAAVKRLVSLGRITVDAREKELTSHYDALKSGQVASSEDHPEGIRTKNTNI